MMINPLMLATALVYGAAGLALTFAPGETVAALGGSGGGIGDWVAQLAGAGLIAFAWLNWMQRYAVLGGVMGRPILGANLLFAVAGTGASVNAWRDSGLMAPLIAAFVLVVPAVAFGILLYRPPRPAA